MFINTKVNYMGGIRMGFFNNLKITTKSISETTTNAVSTVVSASKENAKIYNIKTQLTSINSELDAAYRQIGEKFVKHALKTNEMQGFYVENILKLIAPKLENKNQLNAELIEIEKTLKDQVILQEKAQLENEFKHQKENLDKAKAMGVISDDEYNSKNEQYSRRIDNFESIRNVKKQYELGIISYEELQIKLSNLT